MFGMFKPSPSIIDLTPREVNDGLKNKTILLIDVREPAEFATEHIKGAVNVPLSRLNSETLSAVKSEAEGRALVMQCLAGSRSVQGVRAARALGKMADHHLHGGLNAWKVAGFPTVR